MSFESLSQSTKTMRGGEGKGVGRVCEGKGSVFARAKAGRHVKSISLISIEEGQQCF